MRQLTQQRISDSEPSQTAAMALALIAAFLWASSFIYIEIGLADLEPITFAATRYIIGAATLNLYWLYRGGGGRRGTITGKDALLVALLGVLLYTAVPALQFIGLDRTDSITFNFVFQAGIPLVLALAAGTLLRERTRWWEWLGVAAIIAGVWVFFPVGLDNELTPSGDDLRGVLLAAAAALFIGGSNLIQRRILRDPATSALEVTARSMTLGAALLVVMALLSEGPPHLTPRLVLLLLVLGVINTAVAFFIWHHAIQTLRALHIGVIASSQLIFVPLLSRFFLDEPFGPRRALGSAVVLLGIAIVQYSRTGMSRNHHEAEVASQ